MIRDLDGEAAGRSERFPLVGRQRELERLLAAVRNPPAVVLVEGEPGIGKSRLVREASATLRAERYQVLTGFCHPLREPLPYGPVADALCRADLANAPAFPPSAGALAPLLPDLADRLPPPPSSADPTSRRFQLLQAVRSFLTALGPTVLVVEDLHWTDEATRDLLLLLARDLPPRLSLVLTHRADELPQGTAVLGAAYSRPPGTGGSVIQLNPLRKSEVQELAAAALGPHATPALGATLHRRSEGLPLVAEEDLITLAEHGSTHGCTEAVERLRVADVPRGLREAVTERLTGLSPAAASIAEAAAVLAVPAPEELLTALAGPDAEQGADALIELLRASVLREADQGTYTFRHALAQQVAYQHVPAPPDSGCTGARSRCSRPAIRSRWCRSRTTPSPSATWPAGWCGRRRPRTRRSPSATAARPRRCCTSCSTGPNWRARRVPGRPWHWPGSPPPASTSEPMPGCCADSSTTVGCRRRRAARSGSASASVC
ncbi:ATP-binding protein [Kitasatospora acidiphila]|uniref:ATP-binding protein n=1 Tax=Kitasatospora acidiphila TaxID=2567942 RepID=UPI001E5CE6E8|nr:AAA family ATPase [Kitasatospora acidiphila]